LPVTDRNGYIIGTTGVIAGHHNDSYELEQKLKNLIADMKRNTLDDKGAFFNADSSFDTRAARKLLWNHGLIPNIAENKRNRKAVKRGRKRHFNREVYTHRFVSERTFAWVDKFKTLLIRFERKAAYCLGFHHLGGKTMLNRGHGVAQRSMSCCIALERRPRCFGGDQRGGGTRCHSRSRTVQQ
jgi:transposase